MRSGNRFCPRIKNLVVAALALSRRAVKALAMAALRMIVDSRTRRKQILANLAGKSESGKPGKRWKRDYRRREIGLPTSKVSR
jgi:hypothetical protein